MPRRSAASLSVVAQIDDRRPRIQAPAHLSEPVRAIFDEVVDSVGLGHFRECDKPVLTQLATAMHIAQQAAVAIERDGLTIGPRANPHLAVFDRATKTVAALSAKLRITPSSRLDRKLAGSSTRDERRPAPDLNDLGAIEALLDADEQDDEQNEDSP